jgi:simple sugar transport system permease protein
VFKALVIIAVCLLQSPKTRALLSRSRRPAPPPPAAPTALEAATHTPIDETAAAPRNKVTQP